MKKLTKKMLIFGFLINAAVFATPNTPQINSHLTIKKNHNSALENKNPSNQKESTSSKKNERSSTSEICSGRKLTSSSCGSYDDTGKEKCTKYYEYKPYDNYKCQWDESSSSCKQGSKCN